MKKVLITYDDIVNMNIQQGCLILDELIDWFSLQPDVSIDPPSMLVKNLNNLIEIIDKLVNSISDFTYRMQSLERRLEKREKSEA